MSVILSRQPFSIGSAGELKRKRGSMATTANRKMCGKTVVFENDFLIDNEGIDLSRDASSKRTHRLMPPPQDGIEAPDRFKVHRAPADT